MEVNCEECAGCCIDWRPIAPDPSDHERRGPRTPLDDAYNLVPLTRDDARAFLDAGLADALTPRLWRDEDGVEIDGVSVAAVGGRPVFFLGIRKAPKPVGPFGTDPSWLPTCAFLDPTTLQCRIHDAETYPEECGEYPGHNLELGSETECERVESAFGGERLLDGEPPEDLSALLLGPQALGQKVFVFPDPDRLEGVVGRAAGGARRASDGASSEGQSPSDHASGQSPRTDGAAASDGGLTDDDRALFVAAAAAAAPGTTQVDRDRFESALATAREADSWVGRAIDDWENRADGAGEPAPDPDVADRVEGDRGAPDTPGWRA